MNMRKQGFTGVYMSDHMNTGVYIAIQGLTGVYTGVHKNTGVYRSIHGFS